MWNGWQIAGAILTVGGAVGAAVGGILFWYGGKIQQAKSDREQTEQIKKSVVESGTELKSNQDRILKEIELIRERMDVKQTLGKKELIDASKKTYEVAKNYNANLLLKEGYEKQGSIGSWFTPMWEGDNKRKFFLLDFVGDTNKNRISVYFEKDKLVCRILNYTGKPESIWLDTHSWVKGIPYLIFVMWDTEKSWVQLFACKRGASSPQIEEKIIQDLKFDKLGPLLFMGIDFEGKFPARVAPGSLKLSESQELKEMGYSKYKE